MGMTIERAQTVLQNCQGKKILVVGDAMLDRYVHGHVDRISPEAPVPVVQVIREREVPGGASNVALNLSTLGCKAALCSCIGNDTHGAALKDLLSARHVNSEHVIPLPERQTTVKVRIMADRQQIVRVDWDEHKTLSPSQNMRMQEEIAKAVRESDAVILEDYGKGLMTQELIDNVRDIASDRGIPVGLDPKEGHHLALNGLTVVTPNRKEAFAAAGVVETPPHDSPLDDGVLLNVAEKLCHDWDTELLLITLGAHGMLLMKRDGQPLHIPTQAREVFDVSGAGDTVIGVFMPCLAAEATPDEAARIANAAAGVVVSKLGTATVTCDEILDVIL